jgi:hypothetical protein
MMERAAQRVTDDIAERQMGPHVRTMSGHRMDPPTLATPPDGERPAGEIPAQDPSGREVARSAHAVPRLEAVGGAPEVERVVVQGNVSVRGLILACG